jgi:hypothetical protein
MTNTSIPCTKERLGAEKGHVSVTVIGIKKVGWGYAPWKKSAKGGKTSHGAVQNLFEDPKRLEKNKEYVFQSIKMYSFPREGKADKGPRCDDICTTIEVGQTLHFSLQDFMYEAKPKTERNTFPSEVDSIPAFRLVEMVIEPNVDVQARNGYGIRLSQFRLLPYSMYSYLTPLNKDLLVSSYENTVNRFFDKCVDESSPAYFIRQNLEQKNLGFMVKINPGSYITALPVVVTDKNKEGETFQVYKIMNDDGLVADGIAEIDILSTDLAFYTNTGKI